MEGFDDVLDLSSWASFEVVLQESASDGHAVVSIVQSELADILVLLVHEPRRAGYVIKAGLHNLKGFVKRASLCHRSQKLLAGAVPDGNEEGLEFLFCQLVADALP